MVFFRPFCYNKKEAESDSPALAGKFSDTYPVYWMSGNLQGGESMKSGLVKVSDGGHLLFWLEADKFNNAVAGFAAKL